MKKLTIFLLLLLLCYPAYAQSPFPSNIALKSILVANNTTAVTIKASGGTVFKVEGFNNGATLAYIKLYNTATAVCGSGTPYARYLIPAAAANGVLSASNSNGDAYLNGIYLCVTTGYADNDTGAPGANTYIVNIHYK